MTQDLADELRIKRGRSVRREHQFRVHGQCAGESRPLLLAADNALGRPKPCPLARLGEQVQSARP